MNVICHMSHVYDCVQLHQLPEFQSWKNINPEEKLRLGYKASQQRVTHPPGPNVQVSQCSNHTEITSQASLGKVELRTTYSGSNL